MLLAGRAQHGAWPALSRWEIPEAVSGGLPWALGALLAQALDLATPTVSAAIREALLLAFLATVGLQADLAGLRAAGPRLTRFAALTIGFILVQNRLGIGLAIALALDPLIGLLAGSVTLVSGHGTGAACGALFAERDGLAAALEIALARATLGIVVGGLLAGPVARGLAPGMDGAGRAAAPVRRASEAALIPVLGLVLLCTAAASAFVPLARALPVTLPDFLWAVRAGALLLGAFLALPLFARRRLLSPRP
ncbi:MAG: sodium/glutamate symporter [Rubritepida sp.]|nr:sodium/glutamate symporter [Rubritepida sp.]